jgi:hypothetical protein
MISTNQPDALAEAVRAMQRINQVEPMSRCAARGLPPEPPTPEGHVGNEDLTRAMTRSLPP